MLSACFAEKQKAVRNAFCFSDKVLTSVVVHWWWDTVHLCVCKISKGVFAVTLQCCQPVLAEKQKAVRNAFCFSDKVLTSVVVHWWWHTVHLCVCKISKGVFPVTLQCCQPVLHSNTGQWGMLFVLTSAAVHWWLDTAHLCVWKIFKGVFAVTLQCCQPVLQSNTGQWGMHFVLTSAAVHWYWVTAHLCVWEISKGVFAVTLQCCQLGLQRQHRTVRECILSWPVLQCIGDGTLHTCVFEKYPKVSLQWHYNVVNLFCRATQGSEECILSWPVLQCTGTWVTAHLCVWEISKGVFAVTLQCCQLGLQSTTGQSGMHFVLTSAAVQLVMGHCTPVCLKKIQRCLCSDTTMLSACFAEKTKRQWGMHFVSLTKSWPGVVVHWWWDTVHLCVCKISKGVFGSDTTMLSACFAEKQKAVRNAFLFLWQSPDQCCSALVMAHCTPVCLQNIQRCLSSDTTMLSACFA